MEIIFLSTILTVVGLVVFEIVSSLDNAVVNAQVLSTMKSEKAKKFFLFWGILFAVFVVRGILPSIIVFFANPAIGLFGALEAIWSNDAHVTEAVESATPFLMLGGGMFLFLLFLHWYFVEEKEFGLPFEHKVQKYGVVWFYAIASLVLVSMLVMIDKFVELADVAKLMLATSIGFSAFFIADGFKRNAEEIEERLMEEGGQSSMGDWAKVFFLEILDLTFSIDGVVGAFAFTTSVPLILIGNGIGAIVVRQLTVGNIERIKKYSYLKNGAMYSIGVLGTIMLLEGFGVHVPIWISPVVTVSLIAYFLRKSILKNREEERVAGIK